MYQLICLIVVGKNTVLINIYTLKGDFWIFSFIYDIKHCFICRPSDSTVTEDAGIEPRTVATTALAVRRSNHSARSHPDACRIRMFTTGRNLPKVKSKIDIWHFTMEASRED